MFGPMFDAEILLVFLKQVDSFPMFICWQDGTFNHIHYSDVGSVAFKLTFCV